MINFFISLKFEFAKAKIFNKYECIKGLKRITSLHFRFDITTLTEKYLLEKSKLIADCLAIRNLSLYIYTTSQNLIIIRTEFQVTKCAQECFHYPKKRNNRIDA